MSRLNKIFSNDWSPGDHPLIRGLPSDEVIDKIKAVIPLYLNALKSRTITRDIVTEAVHHVTGRGTSCLITRLLTTLLEEELQTVPRRRTRGGDPRD